MDTRALSTFFGRSPRAPRATVTCPQCDVTWRGTIDDKCWACGRSGSGVLAAAPAIRLRS